MYESNIGQTIKSAVKAICVICIIVCAIVGIMLISQGSDTEGWVVIFAGGLLIAIICLFLYGFGELVDKTCENNAALLRIEKKLGGEEQENNAPSATMTNETTAQESVRPVEQPVPISQAATFVSQPESPVSMPEPAAVAEGEQVKAPLPGNILDVCVSVGQTVKKGDVLLVIEAMKMENEMLAARDGVVASVAVTKGAIVNSGDVLITLK